MLKYLAFFCCLLLASCENDATQTPTTNQVTETPSEKTPAKTPLEILKEQAIDEEDIMARIESGLAKLQAEYDKSETQMPDLGDVTVSVDDKYNLSIENRRGDHDILTTKVNMALLDVESGAFRLIPDHAPGDFPGLRIATKNNEPVVEIYKNGKLFTKNNELVIHLATRQNIEVVVPAMLQTVRLCQE